ncbi:MAG TPA: hypothetical protein VFE05_23530 [Longimicrobiaceae bacterium]|jgi:hypothetical protein|nr:hypothetical protein [Longimicrobiaceae bacterium]
MKIPMAFLADEANISQEGKLNVMGIFDRLAAAEFPVVHPRMVFTFRVQAESGDAGRTFPVQVRLLDDADNPLFEAAGEMVAPIVPLGEFMTANQVFTLVGIQFPRPGSYRFVVSVGEMEPHETPFLVMGPTPDQQLN